MQNDAEMVHGEVKRDTKITFYLGEDLSEFSEERRWKDLVKTLSEFIGFPNELFVEKSNEKKVTYSDFWESAAGDLSPRRKTPRSSPGGSSVTRRSFVLC